QVWRNITRRAAALPSTRIVSVSRSPQARRTAGRRIARVARVGVTVTAPQWLIEDDQRDEAGERCDRDRHHGQGCRRRGKATCAEPACPRSERGPSEQRRDDRQHDKPQLHEHNAHDRDGRSDEKELEAALRGSSQP
ncbi:MAG: hypothetical protein WKF96_12955, partial [Solirubrobacteraceae bacterium]